MLACGPGKYWYVLTMAEAMEIKDQTKTGPKTRCSQLVLPTQRLRGAPLQNHLEKGVPEASTSENP